MAQPIKIWTITPTVWNGVTQTILCHDGHYTWDTDGFSNPENADIYIKHFTVELAGANTLQGDYAFRCWVQKNGSPSSHVIQTGFDPHTAVQDLLRRRWSWVPDYVPMLADQKLWFRIEAGWFSQMGGMDNHQVFPTIYVEYTLQP
jgi:hypothetical protein